MDRQFHRMLRVMSRTFTCCRILVTICSTSFCVNLNNSRTACRDASCAFSSSSTSETALGSRVSWYCDCRVSIVFSSCNVDYMCLIIWQSNTKFEVIKDKNNYHHNHAQKYEYQHHVLRTQCERIHIQ